MPSLVAPEPVGIAGDLIGNFAGVGSFGVFVWKSLAGEDPEDVPVAPPILVTIVDDGVVGVICLNDVVVCRAIHSICVIETNIALTISSIAVSPTIKRKGQEIPWPVNQSVDDTDITIRPCAVRGSHALSKRLESGVKISLILIPSPNILVEINILLIRGRWTRSKPWPSLHFI